MVCHLAHTWPLFFFTWPRGLTPYGACARQKGNSTRKMLHSTFNTQFPPRAACVGCHIFMGNPPGLAQTVCWGVGCRGEPMSAMRRSHALAVQREGAQRIEQGSGGNGRGVGSGQWVGSGPRKGTSRRRCWLPWRAVEHLCRAMRWPFGARGRRGSSEAAGATAEACAAARGWAAG